MKTTLFAFCFFLFLSYSYGQSYFEAKIGFYNPTNYISKGAIGGLSWIKEDLKNSYYFSINSDFYFTQKTTIVNPATIYISQQLLVFLPLYLDIAYKLISNEHEFLKLYLGCGAGIYIYYYRIQSIPIPIITLLAKKSDFKLGNSIFISPFMKLSYHKIFIEPRLFIDNKTEGEILGNKYSVNPSGYSVSIGYQY